MYIQYCTSKRNGKTYTYPLLCHKYREAGKIKTEVIANLSKFPEEVVLAIKGALKKDDPTLVPLKDITIKRSIDYGFVYVLIVIMQRLRINEALEKILGKKDANIAMLMILGKIITRGSKLCIYNWIKRNEEVAKKLGVDLSSLTVNKLYSVLEDLSNVQNKIERKWNIYHKNKTDEVYLYDITSCYFEGTNNALSAFGYNRDRKIGKMQIVVGLITTKDGFPLSIEVFEGNKNDHTTVISQLKKIQKDYGAKEVIFVGDRGMRIRYNLEQFEENEKQGLFFITALSMDEIRSLVKNEVIQLNLFSKDLVEIENEGERYILCTNPELEIEQSQTRASLKQNFEDHLYEIQLSYKTRKLKNDKNKKRLEVGDKNKKLVTCFAQKQIDSYNYRVRKLLERYNMQSFYEVSINADFFNVSFNYEKYVQAKRLDGKYIIVTNVSQEKMTKDIIRNEYKNLKHVEHAFRDMKTSQLDIRPIFHINEATTRGHVFVTMFSYAILRELEASIYPWLKENNKAKKEQLSLQDIKEELKMIKLNILKIGKHHEKIMITELTNKQKEIFDILKINKEILVM